MGYINNLGQANGPIRIDQTWIRSVIKSSPENISSGTKDNNGNEIKPISRDYLAFSDSNISNDEPGSFTKLLAGTPVIGTYAVVEDGKTKYLPYAPLNAVATVDWVIAYASLAPGQQSGFDPDSFARKKDVEEINIKISDHDRRIKDNSTKILINTENIKINKNAIEQLVIDTNNKYNNINSKLTAAEKVNKEQDNRITSIEVNPFPEGLWLICSDKTIL